MNCLSFINQRISNPLLNGPIFYPLLHFIQIFTFKPPQRQSMRDNERRQQRGGDRRGNRFGDRSRRDSRDEGSRPFRKGSRDFNNRRGGQRDGDDRRTKKISRNNQGRGPRDHKRAEDRKPKDLDGELMNYWIKSGKHDPEGKNVAQQKLNEDMDNYWKQRAVEEKVEQKPQQQ